MRNIILLVCALAWCGIVTSSDPSHKCYDTTKDFCRGIDKINRFTTMEKCNSQYSGVSNVMQGLQDYVYQHIIHSYKYLQMSTVFAGYLRNREGFEKFYKHLSDDTWEDTIDLVKYITKRGLKMDFSNLRNNCTKMHSETINYCTSDLDNLIDLDEVQSLSKALDLHKDLAHSAHVIHSQVKRKSNIHDAEVLSFIEEEFVHKHSQMVRTISGHLNDLIDMVTSRDVTDTEANLAVYLFDRYLGKSI